PKGARLLDKAHQSGINREQIHSRFEGCLEYENALRNHFALQNIRVLPALPDADIGLRLGIGAAHMLMESLRPQQLLAVGFGEATLPPVQRLRGVLSAQQIRLVPFSGGGGPA
ncbi:transcriptional regulator LsrR, partial [Salmonella enterica subsp. enterica serovar Poona]